MLAVCKVGVSHIIQKGRFLSSPRFLDIYCLPRTCKFLDDHWLNLNRRNSSIRPGFCALMRECLVIKSQ